MTLCLRLSAPAAATASTRLARSSGRSTGTGSSHSPKQVEARTLMVSGRIALDTDYQCLETAKITYRSITEVLVASYRGTYPDVKANRAGSRTNRYCDTSDNDRQ